MVNSEIFDGQYPGQHTKSYGKSHFFMGKSSKQKAILHSKLLACWRVNLTWVDIHPNKYTYGYGSIPINTIFRGMNIHLPAILMFTRVPRFWLIPICCAKHGSIEQFHRVPYTECKSDSVNKASKNKVIIWVWVNTYRYIFSGMNIHLPAILGFTRGTRFWHTAI